jgi:hypothetical protein
MYKRWLRKQEFHESRLGGIRTLRRESFSTRNFHIYWAIGMKLMTEYRHSFLLMNNEFHENPMSEAHTLLEEANEPVSGFSTCFDRQKKPFPGEVHKNVFSGCNVPENRCNETHIWRAEVQLHSF